ncbi:MAG TPA: hypothetical protein VJP60_03655 [Rhizomicrobium sp.]|nr:hypothetical protein [Rhizomicrobium sp.]
MLHKILVCAALTPILLACAPFAQAGIQSVSLEQLSLVDTTCTQIMGLKKGEYYFAMCRESLSNTLAARKEGQDMAAAYKDCRQRGLADGTAAFSTCMLDSGATGPNPQPVTVAYTPAPGTEPGKSFYSVPPHVQFQRERYSCAQLGLLPGSGAFGQCVAGLEGAMMPTTD